ncbi:hypothetical protein BN1095_3420001 [Clostridioides difficile]|uniref:Uncharacterized protein n=1 Tax=Clostridioides difficile TaxID=1496 RepID=A0A069APQ0_CLODI|nr:hypothetical protein BN1095_3420001 [Clostridioides difficile]
MMVVDGRIALDIVKDYAV